MRARLHLMFPTLRKLSFLAHNVAVSNKLRLTHPPLPPPFFNEVDDSIKNEGNFKCKWISCKPL